MREFTITESGIKKRIRFSLFFSSAIILICLALAAFGGDAIAGKNIELTLIPLGLTLIFAIGAIYIGLRLGAKRLRTATLIMEDGFMTWNSPDGSKYKIMYKDITDVKLSNSKGIAIKSNKSVSKIYIPKYIEDFESIFSRLSEVVATNPQRVDLAALQQSNNDLGGVNGNKSETLQAEESSSEETKSCPFCGEHINITATKCKHCDEWLTTRTTVSGKQQFSNAQPVWHFILLSILTLGFYQFVWFYRNWKQLKKHKNLDIRPGWRTAGLLVPFYGLVLVYNQLRDIRNYSMEEGIERGYSPGPVLIVWLLTDALWRLPNPYWLLSLMSVVPLAIVQAALNRYWESVAPGLPVRTKFSGRQVALLIIGGLFTLIVFLGTFVPASP